MRLAVRQAGETIEELLVSEPGAEIDAINRKGETPLDLAVKTRQPKVAELLRKRGARQGARHGISEACV